MSINIANAQIVNIPDTAFKAALVGNSAINTNQLTSLSVQNGINVNFSAFNANYNPNLTCIQVDHIL